MSATTDALWLLNDPAHYLGLVVRRGWGEDEFGAWLAGQFSAAVAGTSAQTEGSDPPASSERHASARSTSPSSSGPSVPLT